jgi:dihydropteroate synthase
MLNDISGLRRDTALARVAAETGAALVLMHMRGVPADMYRYAQYDDVVADVAAELAWSVAQAVEAGVPRESLVIDPGLGFAKQAAQSWAVLGGLTRPCLRDLDLPILLGASRKSFLQEAIGEHAPGERDAASLAAATVAALSGAHIVRVHDVGGSVQAVRVADMISAVAETGPR